jgi:hypothetical protein
MDEGQEQRMKISAYLLFPVSRFNTIHEIWMTAAARRKAAWEARGLVLMSGCSNPFADKAKAPGSGGDASLDGADSSSSSGSGEGATLDGADASSSSDATHDVIYASSQEHEDV